MKKIGVPLLGRVLLIETLRYDMRVIHLTLPVPDSKISKRVRALSIAGLILKIGQKLIKWEHFEG